MTAVTVFAPAKINLALHVVGRRADGFHLLDSLVGFAHHGDTVRVEQAGGLSLDISGPFAASVPPGEDNLVLRAARLVGGGRGARITLVKRLPAASGIGGGSADAAATIRALSELWNLPWPEAASLAALGADVPVCLTCGMARMTGIGEVLEPLGLTPAMPGLLLVNPGFELATADVFAALRDPANSPLSDPVPVPGPTGAAFDTWMSWLARQRNDLEPAAVALFPAIGALLGELRSLPGCRLARMSGSGATCFAILDRDASAAATALRQGHPDWWVVETAGWSRVFGPSATDGRVS